jgi:hypothetical protein
MTPMPNETEEYYREQIINEGYGVLTKNPAARYDVSLNQVPTEKLEHDLVMAHLADNSYYDWCSQAGGYTSTDYKNDPASGLQMTKFEKDGKIILAIRGTDDLSGSDGLADLGILFVNISESHRQEFNGNGQKQLFDTIDTLSLEEKEKLLVELEKLGAAGTVLESLKSSGIVPALIPSTVEGMDAIGTMGVLALHRQFIEAEKIYLAAKEEGKEIELTGHSLGGVVAQYLSDKYGEKATVFNSPGIAVIAPNGSNVTNYSSPEFISRFGDKSGIIVNMPKDVDDGYFSYVDVKGDDSTHSSSRAIMRLEDELKRREAGQ